jgi:type VI secretion system secreted protein Hcp
VLSTFLSAEQLEVQELYRDFLGRPGSEVELDGWVNAIPVLGHEVVAADIARSPEGLGNLVNNLYEAELGRKADPGGQAWWAGFLQQGHTAEEVAAAIAASGEFAQRADALLGNADSNFNFVRALYLDWLNRPGADAEIAGWVNDLASQGRTTVAQEILGSVESRDDAALQLYDGAGQQPLPDLLHRTATPAAVEISFWAAGRLDLLTIAVSIAQSVEFRDASGHSDPTALSLTLTPSDGTPIQIPVDSYSWGVTNAGRPVQQDVSFTAPVSAASPLLVQAVGNNTSFLSAVLTCTNTNRNPKPYLEISFTNVFVSSYRVGTNTTPPEDTFAIHFQAMTMTYDQIQSKGDQAQPVTSKFDFTAESGSIEGAGAATETAAVAAPISLSIDAAEDGEGAKGQVPTSSFAWAATNPGTGIPAAGNVQIAELVGQQSGEFFEDCVAGTPVASATLIVRGPLGQEYLKYTFSNIQITGYSIRANSDGAVESISLHFNTVVTEAHAINPDGSLGPPVITTTNF